MTKDKNFDVDESMEKEIKAIFAKPVVVLVGDMKFSVKTVPMGKMDEIAKLLSEYNTVLKKNNFEVKENVVSCMAKIIRIGIKDHHPAWTEEKIAAYIPYEYFPDFVKAITGNENFQKKMMAMGGGITNLT